MAGSLTPPARGIHAASSDRSSLAPFKNAIVDKRGTAGRCCVNNTCDITVWLVRFESAILGCSCVLSALPPLVHIWRQRNYLCFLVGNSSFLVQGDDIRRRHTPSNLLAQPIVPRDLAVIS
jgi:hypothetical protein